MKPKAVIIDLDGTLANCDHRRHYVQKDNYWTKFYEEMVNDPVNEWCRNLIDLYSKKYEILLVTGRPEDYLKHTSFWLADNKIQHDQLYMRSKKDYHEDSIVKKEIYKSLIEPNYDVELVVDDRNSVVKMWRSLGLVCLQCAEGNF